MATQIQMQREMFADSTFDAEMKSMEDRRLKRLMQHELPDVEERLVMSLCLFPADIQLHVFDNTNHILYAFDCLP